MPTVLLASTNILSVSKVIQSFLSSLKSIIALSNTRTKFKIVTFSILNVSYITCNESFLQHAYFDMYRHSLPTINIPLYGILIITLNSFHEFIFTVYSGCCNTRSTICWTLQKVS